MNSAARKIPVGRRQLTQSERLRRRVFCLCAELGIDDEARRDLAATCRKNGKRTMSGMNAFELYEMVNALGRASGRKLETSNLKLDSRAGHVPTHAAANEDLPPQGRPQRNAPMEERERLKRQKKRIYGLDKPEIASEQAKFVLRELAKAYWGEGEWSVRLNKLLISKHNAGYFITHDQPRLPTRTVWEATEALKAMLGR